MSQRLPGIKPREFCELQRAGFEIHHVSGSHYILKHSEKAGMRVTLPWHNRDLKPKTVASIIKQAGYTLDEFLDLL